MKTDAQTVLDALNWKNCREVLPTKTARYVCKIYTDFGAYIDVLSWDNHDKVFRKYKDYHTAKKDAEVFDWQDTLILWKEDQDAALPAAQRLVEREKRDFFNTYETFTSWEFEIDEKMIEFGLSWERSSYDSYDSSIEFYGVAPDCRLNQEALDYLKSIGFSRCWLNHKDNMETYYGFAFPERNIEARESRRESAQRLVEREKTPNVLPKQEPLDAEFQKVLDDNLSEILVRGWNTPTPPTTREE